MVLFMRVRVAFAGYPGKHKVEKEVSAVYQITYNIIIVRSVLRNVPQTVRKYLMRNKLDKFID